MEGGEDGAVVVDDDTGAEALGDRAARASRRVRLDGDERRTDGVVDLDAGWRGGSQVLERLLGGVVGDGAGLVLVDGAVVDRPNVDQKGAEHSDENETDGNDARADHPSTSPPRHGPNLLPVAQAGSAPRR